MPARPCRVARLRRGFTVTQAARLLNVSSRHLARVEAGYERLSFALSERMARLYECAQLQLHINPAVPE
jgi:transcriptional regulator with XRE-family HTH domain